MEPAYKLLSVEEFLDECPNDRRHYQLFDGVMVAMAPPGGRRQIIALAIGALLYTAVEARMPGCTVRSQAGIAPQGVRGRDHFETDITVTCEPLDDRRRGIVANPLQIVEVLSPSTDRDDVIVKLPAYQSIASLREIVYVETDRIAATVYRRTGDAWQAIALSSPEARLQLETIGLDLRWAACTAAFPGSRAKRLFSAAVGRMARRCQRRANNSSRRWPATVAATAAIKAPTTIAKAVKNDR